MVRKDRVASARRVRKGGIRRCGQRGGLGRAAQTWRFQLCRTVDAGLKRRLPKEGRAFSIQSSPKDLPPLVHDASLVQSCDEFGGQTAHVQMAPEDRLSSNRLRRPRAPLARCSASVTVSPHPPPLIRPLPSSLPHSLSCALLRSLPRFLPSPCRLPASCHRLFGCWEGACMCRWNGDARGTSG